MKKLYTKIRKRLAKKRLGASWYPLQYGLTLKPGDLVSSCKGYNERIKEIEPIWSGNVVIDFDIIVESGSSCSLFHCCTFPLKSKEEIVAYILSWDSPEAKKWAEEGGWEFGVMKRQIEALKAGKEVFDDNGQPLFEFCTEHEQKSRFNKEN